MVWLRKVASTFGLALLCSLVFFGRGTVASEAIELITNGGFETGDWTGWTHGGVLEQSITTRDPHTGQYAALLGDPNHGNTNVPLGSNWCSQTFNVPSGGPTALSFWYRIETYDGGSHDYFEVLIVDSEGSYSILQDAGTGEWGTYQDLGWKSVSYDMTGFAGSAVSLELIFSESNTIDKFLNTWVTIDDISLLFTPLDATPPTIVISSPTTAAYSHDELLMIEFHAVDESGVASTLAELDGIVVRSGDTIELMDLSLGSHILAVTASDIFGNTATKSVSFTVGTDIASLKRITTKFYEKGEIDSQGTYRSLMQKLNAVEKDVAQDHNTSAINVLRAYINEVDAQTGKQISYFAASLMIGDANCITSSL